MGGSNISYVEKALACQGKQLFEYVRSMLEYAHLQ